MHDLRVVTGVGRHWDARQQGVQVRRAADPQQLAALAQLVGDRDRVSRLAASVEVGDSVVDLLVRGPIEVGAPQHLDDVSDCVLAHQHGAKHALLGLHVLRRRTVGESRRLVAVGRHHLGNTHPYSLQIRWTLPPSPSDTRPSTNRIRVRNTRDMH